MGGGGGGHGLLSKGYLCLRFGGLIYFRKGLLSEFYCIRIQISLMVDEIYLVRCFKSGFISLNLPPPPTKSTINRSNKDLFDDDEITRSDGVT